MTAHQKWLGISSPTADINSDAPQIAARWQRAARSAAVVT